MTIVAPQRTEEPPMWGSFEALVAAWSELDAPEGYRVEVAQGAIRMSPAPATPHALLVVLVREILTASIASELVVVENVPVRLDAVEAVYIPDLVVIARRSLERAADRRDRYLTVDAPMLAVEVTSASNARVDRNEKLAGYAGAGVPCYLLVDAIGRPRVITVHSEPTDGRYGRSTAISFGGTVRLPAPLGVELDTSSFPR